METDKTSHSLPQMVVPSALARATRVSEKTIFRLLRSGRIHGVKVGGQWRIPHEEYQRVLREGVQS